ncbi:YeeE/YedE family protein [Rhodobaculum claviforme]|uniref:YeeE/YedE n=1 Tax=Rhodobaculum claviforme TaxID=1549854 RepID=A0A934TM77_9RHOB|nr:YeeE/YedE family protein [Rhodobaculum claviforme]MBK5927732.1 YeeE/YedE [Rhodobaculum claviforme]
MIARRVGLTAFALVLVGLTFAWAGPRAAFLVAIGLGFGLVLEGLRFGFAGPWRAMVADRDARGLLAQLGAIGVTAAVALPLLAMAPNELSGAHAPVGIGMILGAFVFGIAMQIVLGCGSGTLVNAGSGNIVGLVALAGFVAGSFAGTLHLGFWTGLGTLPTLTLQGIAGPTGGLVLTLAGLAAVGAVAWRRAEAGKRIPPVRLWIAAGLIAVLAILNLVVAGQSWGIVYGLGLWGAKVAQAGGADLAATAFWSAPANAERLGASILTDVTSLTNIGLIAGAYLAMRWKSDPGAPPAALTVPSWVAVLVAGLVLGYSARMAFGCNVGAFFSGISTGSLHGWVWFAAAFAGSGLGLRLRPRLLVQRAMIHRGQPA